MQHIGRGEEGDEEGGYLAEAEGRVLAGQRGKKGRQGEGCTSLFACTWSTLGE